MRSTTARRTPLLERMLFAGKSVGWILAEAAFRTTAGGAREQPTPEPSLSPWHTRCRHSLARRVRDRVGRLRWCCLSLLLDGGAGGGGGPMLPSLSSSARRSPPEHGTSGRDPVRASIRLLARPYPRRPVARSSRHAGQARARCSSLPDRTALGTGSAPLSSTALPSSSMSRLERSSGRRSRTDAFPLPR